MTAGELSPQGQASGLSAALGATTLQSVPEAYRTAAPSGQWSAEPGPVDPLLLPQLQL